MSNVNKSPVNAHLHLLLLLLPVLLLLQLVAPAGLPAHPDGVPLVRAREITPQRGGHVQPEQTQLLFIKAPELGTRQRVMFSGQKMIDYCIIGIFSATSLY